MSSLASAGSLAVAAASAFLATASGQAPASHAYVQASRVAVRAQPSATAAAVDYLTTNTDVEIEERSGEWCRVRSGTIRGFMACRMLGNAKLTIEAIDAKLREPKLSPPDALDWESRGFWVSPSLVRFVAVGYRMEKALLTPAMHHAEQMTERSARPANAEFDAMKRRLEKGIVASGRPPARYIPEEPLTSAMKRAALPQIRPSFFRADEPRLAIALRPFTLGDEGRIGPGLTDILSAAHGVSFRARIARPVRFAYFGAFGVWDISEVRVTFDKEVTINGIAASGTPVSVRFSSLLTPVGNDSCSGSSFDIEPSKPGPGWRSAIVAWVGKAAPGKAAVVSRRVGGNGKYDKLVIETVDLDGDGVPDFSLWAGLEPPGIETETFWKAVFGNVGGKWELLAFSQEADCT
jgi:hypothetical protein